MHFQLKWAYTAWCMEHMNVNRPDWTIQCVQPLLILTIGPSNQEGGMAWIWMESPELWHFCWVETPYLKIPNIHRLPCSEIKIITELVNKESWHLDVWNVTNIFLWFYYYTSISPWEEFDGSFVWTYLNSPFSICFIVPSIVEFHLLILDIFEITKLIPLIHNDLQL